MSITNNNKRIALCLSGQLRFVNRAYTEVIYPFVLEGNGIDVFIHTWAIDDDQDGRPYINGSGHIMGNPVDKNVMLDILNLYNPVKCLIQKQVEFEYGKYSERAMPGIRSDYMYSMFYSIYKANQLKIDYERENNFKYDIVIRSRFDVKLMSKIDLAVPTDKMYLPSGCFDSTKGYVDCFGYSNSELMNVYCDTFNHIDRILNLYPIGMCGEYILRKQLDEHNIPIEQNYWHSLYR